MELTQHQLACLFGWISIGCWVIVFTPQLYENYKRKSGEAVSIMFIGIWICSDFLYIGTCALNKLLITAVASGIYFLVMDITVLMQILYYRRQARKRKEALQNSNPEREGLLSPRSPAPSHRSHHSHSHASANSSCELEMPLSIHDAEDGPEGVVVPGSGHSSSGRSRKDTRSHTKKALRTTAVAAGLAVVGVAMIVLSMHSTNTSGLQEVSASSSSSSSSSSSASAASSVSLESVSAYGLVQSPEQSQEEGGHVGVSMGRELLEWDMQTPRTWTDWQGWTPSYRFINLVAEEDDSVTGWRLIVAQFCGWSCAFLSIVSRIPQILKNYQAKTTEGLSMKMFFFTISGNITFMVSIFVESMEPAYLIRNVPVLLSAGGTLIFDFTICFQSYYYGDATKMQAEDLDEIATQKSPDDEL